MYAGLSNVASFNLWLFFGLKRVWLAMRDLPQVGNNQFQWDHRRVSNVLLKP